MTQEEAGEEISPVAADMHELQKKLCVVRLWCIQMRSRDRLTMSEVIGILEAGTDGLERPSRPFFLRRRAHPCGTIIYVQWVELSAVYEEDDV